MLIDDHPHRFNTSPIEEHTSIVLCNFLGTYLHSMCMQSIYHAVRVTVSTWTNCDRINTNTNFTFEIHQFN